MRPLPFKNRPLRDKLAHTGFLLTSAAIAILLTTLLAYQLAAQRTSLREGMQAHAMVIGSNGTAAIMFGNADEAHETLASLSAVPDVTWAAFLLPNGQELASYRQQRAEPLVDRVESEGIGWFSLLVRHPIMLHGQLIGSVVLRASLASLYHSLALQAAFGALAAALALALSLVLNRRIASGIVRPLLSLVQLTEQVRTQQDFSLRASVYGNDEAGRLARSFNDMMEQLEWHDARVNAELEQRLLTEQQLNRLAYHDPVTGLHNRHYFKEKLETAVAEALRYTTSCAVLFIDLDDFKMVNDTLGHETGDKLLSLVAERLRAALRSNDVVCRIGGDEFAVIIENGVSAAQAEHVAANIVAALCSPFVIDGQQIGIGASLGISLCPEHATDTISLLRNADTAMYLAKGNGKNNYRLYEADMENGSIRRFSLEQSLRLALDQGQLQLLYQPLVELCNGGRLVGFEALLRWNHPELGVIGPQEFIPLAEESGLIHPIGDWVMHNAFRQAQEWQAICPGVRVGINLSGRQLKQADAVQRIFAACEAAGLPAQLIDIELTESILMDDHTATVAKLQALRAAGMRISLDDFGTGYSSLNYLKLYPVDTLKIDRSFVANLPEDASSAAITQAIMAIANGLSLTVVAEGVESEAHADFLRGAGCPVAQGYLYAKPLDAVAATELAMRHHRTGHFSASSHHRGIERGDGQDADKSIGQ
jgi:diguanylate cyclase (GGDEF)-like protein